MLNCILVSRFLKIVHKKQNLHSLNGGLFIWKNNCVLIKVHDTLLIKNTVMITHVGKNHVSLGFFWPLYLENIGYDYNS
jgi:hypothetical protein